MTSPIFEMTMLMKESVIKTIAFFQQSHCVFENRRIKFEKKRFYQRDLTKRTVGVLFF